MKIIAIASAVSGVLFGVSLSYPALWFLSLVGLVPFLSAWHTQVKTVGAAWWSGIILAATLAGTVYFWGWSLLPMEWAGFTTPFLGFILVFFVWSYAIIQSSILWGLWGGILFHLSKRFSWSIVCVPALWIVFEWGSAWISAFFVYSPESFMGPHYTFPSVGYALAAHPILLQFSKFGGVYTLGFIAIACNILLYWCLVREKSLRVRCSAIIFFVVLVGSSFVPLPLTHEMIPKNSLSVAVLHTYFPTSVHLTDEERQHRTHVYEGLLETVSQAKEKTDVVVFPEDSRFTRGFLNASVPLTFYDKLLGDGVLVVDSGLTEDPKVDSRGHILMYETGTGIENTYDKKLLTPFGEYLPSLSKTLFDLFGLHELVDFFDRNHSYKKGSELPAVSGGTIKVGVLLCSEVSSPELSHNLASAGARLVVSEASHARFHDSRMLFNQIQAMAKVRAVENGLPFLYAGNVAPSFILDAYGTVIAQSGWHENSVVTGKVELK